MQTHIQGAPSGLIRTKKNKKYCHILLISFGKNDQKMQGRNMVYPGPIDPYFLAVILIPEPHFPQNFDPWALIKELILSMFLHKILT